MDKRSANVLPKTEQILMQMGNQIKLARLRRNLSMEVVCERAHISRATLTKIEKEIQVSQLDFMPSLYMH